MESFVLDGVRYYQQVGRCGKPNCERCRSGVFHGVYWYSRAGNVRRYVGRHLPENVERARDARTTNHDRIMSRVSELRLHADILERLTSDAELSDAEKRIVDALGYGDCLTELPGETEVHGI